MTRSFAVIEFEYVLARRRLKKEEDNLVVNEEPVSEKSFRSREKQTARLLINEKPRLSKEGARLLLSEKAKFPVLSRSIRPEQVPIGGGGKQDHQSVDSKIVYRPGNIDRNKQPLKKEKPYRYAKKKRQKVKEQGIISDISGNRLPTRYCK